MVSDKTIHKALEFINLYKQTPLEKFFIFTIYQNYRPIYIGKTQKSTKNLVFVVVPFTLPEKPITFGFFGTKAHARKTPNLILFFGVSGAHARLLSTFDRT